MSFDPERDQPGLQVVQEALGRWQTMPPIPILISRWDAYVLVGLLQLVTRHPQMEGQMKEIAIGVGRQLQEHLADNPEIYNLMETGWNPALDVEQEEAEGPAPRKAS